MNGIDETVILFTKNLLFIPLFLCLALFQSMVIVQLIWRSIGIVLPIKKTLIPSILVLTFVWAARMAIIVPYHMFAAIICTTIIITIVNKVNFLRAAIGVLFAHTVIVIGSIIIIEPILFMTTADKKPLFFRNLFDYSIGIILETLLPLLVLLFFIRKNIVLLRVPPRDTDHDS